MLSQHLIFQIKVVVLSRFYAILLKANNRVMTGNEGKEIWETNLTRQMVCYTEPSGELFLDTVWKRASTFKKHMDKPCV